VGRWVGEDAEDDEDEGVAGLSGDEETADGSNADPYPRLRRTRFAISARRLRICELVLVLLVAFGSPLILSTWLFLRGHTPGAHSPVALLDEILSQVVGLAVLAYVLFRRGQSWQDLGLTRRWIDVPAGGLLLFAAILAHRAARQSINWLALLATGHELAAGSPHPHIAGVTAITLESLLAVINPIYEEVTVRAFTMTEVEALTGSGALAIAASVGLQTAYHLYQGVPSALAVGACFLLFACFFARFGRIVPVILAHMSLDLIYVAQHV
jgi:membrane protease YdiL (CAAX protease family)